MPTYSYACTECGNRFDVAQSFTDDALTTCDACGGRLRKLFGSVGVVFKGSGFYRTDSRDSSRKASTHGNGHSKAAEKSESGAPAKGPKESGGSDSSAGTSEKKDGSAGSSGASSGSQSSPASASSGSRAGSAS